MTNKYSNEKELLLALKNHDEEGIKYFYQANWPMILQLVKLNSGNEHQAKDLYQDCIMTLLEKVWAPEFTLSCKLSVFLYAICKNKWLYTIRAVTHTQVVDIENYAEDQVVPDDLITDPVEKDELSAENLPLPEELIDSITCLGDPCKTLLIGFYYKRFSMEQLAKKLRFKNARVAKQRKFICIKRLRQSFTEPVNIYKA